MRVLATASNFYNCIQPQEASDTKVQELGSQLESLRAQAAEAQAAASDAQAAAQRAQQQAAAAQQQQAASAAAAAQAQATPKAAAPVGGAPAITRSGAGSKAAAGGNGSKASASAANTAAPEPEAAAAAVPELQVAGGAPAAASGGGGGDASASTWQAYLDRYLLTDLGPGVPRLARAAIIGADSGVWAADAGFPAITASEAAGIEALLSRAPAAAAAGAPVNGKGSGGAGGNGKSSPFGLPSLGGKKSGGGGGAASAAASVFTLGGKAYEAGPPEACGALLCKPKGGFLGMGAPGGLALASTGRGVIVAGGWERAAGGAEERVYAEAVARLAAALTAYGY